MDIFPVEVRELSLSLPLSHRCLSRWADLAPLDLCWVLFLYLQLFAKALVRLRPRVGWGSQRAACRQTRVTCKTSFVGSLTRTVPALVDVSKKKQASDLSSILVPQTYCWSLACTGYLNNCEPVVNTVGPSEATDDVWPRNWP